MSFGLKTARRLHDQLRGSQIYAQTAATDPDTPPDIAVRLRHLAKSLDTAVEQASELLDEASRRP